MVSESSRSMPPLPLWERSDRIGDAIRVRGFALTIDRDPSPQPSPTRGEGAHHRCGDLEPFQSKWIYTLTMRLWLICLILLTPALPARAGNRLNVVASFSILGDFAKNVGGERVSVTTLVGPDGDVHVYTPAPPDAQKIADAKLVVINGLGLEGWLSRLVQFARRHAPLITPPPSITPPKPRPHAVPHT